MDFFKLKTIFHKSMMMMKKKKHSWHKTIKNTHTNTEINNRQNAVQFI